jgi:hypothetical protein
MTNKVGGTLAIFQFVVSSCFVILTLHYAGNEPSNLRCVAANVFFFELIHAAVPSHPVLDSLEQLLLRGSVLSTTPAVLHPGHQF